MYAVCINCGEWLSGSPLSSLNRSPFPLNTVWVLFRNCLNCNLLRWSHIHFICLGTDGQSFSAGYLELPSLNLSYNLKFISLVQGFQRKGNVTKVNTMHIRQILVEPLDPGLVIESKKNAKLIGIYRGD